MPSSVMVPIEIAFTRTAGASSAASVRVKCHSAALVMP